MTFSHPLAAKEETTTTLPGVSYKSIEIRDAKIRKKQKDIDLSGVKRLTYSSDKKLVAGTLRAPNKKGWFIKIWDVKKKKLLHELSIPGVLHVTPSTLHAIAFTPDSKSLVTSDAGSIK